MNHKLFGWLPRPLSQPSILNSHCETFPHQGRLTDNRTPAASSEASRIPLPTSVLLRDNGTNCKHRRSCFVYERVLRKPKCETLISLGIL
jgi:hypothetical protein